MLGREDFEEFVAARSAALLRTAYLLTGNHHDAEDLVQTALIKAVPAWAGSRGTQGLTCVASWSARTSRAGAADAGER